MFSFEPAHTVTSIDQLRPGSGEQELLKAGTPARQAYDFDNQFCIFQFGFENDAPTLVEPWKVKPTITGSREQPDVLAAVHLMSFHLAASEAIDQQSRATLRLIVGKDAQSSDTIFDTAFWAIAAGLKLYDAAKSGRASASDLGFSSHAAFGKRPIEIPGGLSSLTFEVVKHQEPPWYRRLFRFLGGNIGESLVSLLGFPALTLSAVRAVDELLERLKQEQPLFESRPLRLALSDYSRDALAGGHPNVRVGVLAQGYNVLARGRDFDRFNEAPLVYYPHHNRLAPRDVSEAKVLANAYEDPLEDVSYAICMVGLRETKLDPTFDFHVD